MTTTGEFDWTSQQQGLVLGGFAYGYCATQLLGGILAERYGGKWIYGICTGVSAALGVLLPLLAGVDFALVVVLRAIQGAFQGCSIPAFYVMASRWIPNQERARLFTFMMSGMWSLKTFVRNYIPLKNFITGMQLGTVLSITFSGLLCHYVGWQYVYYISSAVAMAWFVLWTLLVHDAPKDHPRITDVKNVTLLYSTNDFLPSFRRSVITSRPMCM